MAEKIRIRPAGEGDVRPTFDLSNEPLVRTNSIHAEPISWDGHVAWFRKTLADPLVRFYVAETAEGEFAGQVRFRRENGDWVVSISVAPGFRGRGVGRAILEEAMRHSGLRGFAALIRDGNAASRKMFAACGFRLFGETAIGGARFGIWRHGRVQVVAELSANHCGDFELAKRAVAAAKEAGADAVKVQTYTADTLTIDSARDEFLIKDPGSPWRGRYLHELYQKASMPWEWQSRLKEFADSIGIPFFSTPFDRTAVDFLEGMGVPMYKIASFEAMDYPLIRYAARLGRPMLISTGVSTLDEIQRAIDACREVGNDDITLLKCTSAYPARLEDMNVMTIRDMVGRFGPQGVKVGLSDHSMSSVPVVAAVALGAVVVEKHFTLDRAAGGEDSAFSLDRDEFAGMVEAVRSAEASLGAVDYSVNEKGRMFARSLYAVEDIRAGERLTEGNVRSIRPSGGLPPGELPRILGMAASCDIPRGTPLRWEFIAGRGG